MVLAECEEKNINFPKHDEYVEKINEYRKIMVEGNQRNGNNGKLPTGENVAEMEWSCELERKASETLQSCPTDSQLRTDGTTEFLHSKDDGRDPMDVWLSEINNTNIDLHEHPEAPVKCHGKNRNYCNLVRYDASRIGCAKKECDGKTSVLCLTNKPPLQNEDVLYYWGRGACPIGKCRAPTNGCNNDTGLCFQPQTTRKARAIKKKLFWKKRRNQATLIGTFGPPATPTCLTRAALSTNRPCIGLTSFEFKQMGVADDTSALIRVT
ncbi:hypothetical protein Y032_0489g2365 [Ancylostoma ceylanicum]|uniref:SCP domain-containing protein n=1 Tax=Ancylostoma ceylanicum TaxID=53326 RepID=A0A016WUV9_9BILA|nr:hypothetical protein Y032_0489g2365 [Ancylostoma ceylanicum]